MINIKSNKIFQILAVGILARKFKVFAKNQLQKKITKNAKKKVGNTCARNLLISAKRAKLVY